MFVVERMQVDFEASCSSLSAAYECSDSSDAYEATWLIGGCCACLAYFRKKKNNSIVVHYDERARFISCYG